MADFNLEIQTNLREIRAQVRDLGRQFDRIGSTGVNRLNRNLKTTERTTSNIQKNMTRAFSVGIIAGFTRVLGRASDEVTRFDNTLRAIVESDQERLVLAEELRDIARDNFISANATADLYLTLNATRRNTLATERDNLRVTESLAALSAGLGLNAIQTNTLNTQIGQSLGQQRVELENIKTLNEASPAALEQIRQAYERQTGDTRSLLEVTRAGNLSGQVLFRTLLGVNEQAIALRQNATVTFAQAFRGVRESFNIFADGLLQTGNAGKLFVGVLETLSKVLESSIFINFSQFSLIATGLFATLSKSSDVIRRFAVDLPLAQKAYQDLAASAREYEDALAGSQVAQSRLGLSTQELNNDLSDIQDSQRDLVDQHGTLVKSTGGLGQAVRGLLTSWNFWLIAISTAISLFAVFYKSLDDQIKLFNSSIRPLNKFREDVEAITKALGENTEESRKNIETRIALIALGAREDREEAEDLRDDAISRNERNRALLEQGGRGGRRSASEEELQTARDQITRDEAAILKLNETIQQNNELQAAAAAGPQALIDYYKSLDADARDGGVTASSTTTAPEDPLDPFGGAGPNIDVQGRNASSRALRSSGQEFVGAFNETGDNIVNSLDDSIRNAIENGGNFRDFGKFFEQQLTSALLQSAGDAISSLISTGLTTLFNSFGSTGFAAAPTGGADGGLFRFNTGGFVRGPGTSRSDSINARLSNGEFVVNAQATRNNLGALHAINNGQNVGGGEFNFNANFTVPGDFTERSQEAIQQYMPDIAQAVEYALRENGSIR